MYTSSVLTGYNHSSISVFDSPSPEPSQENILYAMVEKYVDGILMLRNAAMKAGKHLQLFLPMDVLSWMAPKKGFMDLSYSVPCLGSLPIWQNVSNYLKEGLRYYYFPE